MCLYIYLYLYLYTYAHAHTCIYLYGKPPKDPPCWRFSILTTRTLEPALLKDPRTSDFGSLHGGGPCILRIILESFLIRAGIQDPRFLGGLPKESWIQYLPESSESVWKSVLILAGIQDPRLPRSLSQESWILDPSPNQK